MVGIDHKLQAADFIRHSYNMFLFTRQIIDKLNLDKEQQDELLDGMLLHDIGKFRVKQEYLYANKMTEEAWRGIQEHPVHGFSMLAGYHKSKNVMACILYHHERYDGKGYPFQMKGDEIPYLAQIVAVLDGFETATSGRYYQQAVSKEEAIESILRNKGTKYSPEVVDILVPLLKNIDLNEMIK